MAEKFSGALRLADLNDFIAPSQSCVVSLGGKLQVKGDPTDKDASKYGEVKLQSRQLRAPVPAESQPVKVTLHDCLACSGCVTSAETVMLEQQSTGEFLSQLQSTNKAVIVSLSPQSRASLAAHYNITPLQAFRKLTGFLRSLGVRAVFDTSCSRDLALLEASEEFVARYRAAANQHSAPGDPQVPPAGPVPMLASACPGWVCYAEKTHGASLLPYISSTKSPQQVMGALVKRHACRQLGLRPEQVYHVTIMPCYDKKLEASREDFIFAVEPEEGRPALDQSQRVTEVDCVLTSGEIHELLESKVDDFGALEEAPLDRIVDEEGHLYGVRGGSGGYAECIFRHAARVLFGRALEGALDFKAVRNADFREVSLEVDGKAVLKFACAYGFRNIQNLVRKVKMGRSEYHFVEIMACPGGCLNGGGQVKPRKGRSQKDLLQDLESLYLKEVGIKDPGENLVARALYEEWLGHPYSPKAIEILHTNYHHREKTVGTQISNW